jgi:tRNA (adenine22-N1)-methyltransferase
MRISNRLKCISEFVEDNDKIIDIGCDHALLDIYLMNNKNNINLIASDIHEGAIKNAKKNISKHALLDKIDLRLGDGLNVINENEVDTIIIAGMGYYSIEKILSNSEKMNKIKKIIVQSNTDVVKLRKFVIKLGYKIEDELLVKDKDIIYTIIKFTLGKEKYSYEEIYFGPKILSKKDDLFLEYYNKKLLKYENLLLQLPKYEIKNILHHKHLIRIIKKELSK